MRQVIIDNGMAWKRVDTIDEAYAMWRMGYEPHSLIDVWMNRKFELIETGDDMDAVIERDEESVYFNMGSIHVEDCSNQLRLEGFCVDALSHSSSIQHWYECTDKQAYEIMYYSRTADEVYVEIKKAMHKIAEGMKLNKKIK